VLTFRASRFFAAIFLGKRQGLCVAWGGMSSIFAWARYLTEVENDLSILVVEPDRAKACEIIDALQEGGWQDVTVIGSSEELERKLEQQDPDIILIDLANPDRDTLEHLSSVSNARDRPVAMFVDHTDALMTQAAISAGLSAYVVNGLQKDRIKPVIETAIARFRMIAKIQSELDAAKQALTDRKTIDRAKGILMLARKIPEEEAYNLLRKAAMDQGRKIIDVATALVTSADLLQ
jgi:response regulator NasT